MFDDLLGLLFWWVLVPCVVLAVVAGFVIGRLL